MKPKMWDMEAMMSPTCSAYQAPLPQRSFTAILCSQGQALYAVTVRPLPLLALEGFVIHRHLEEPELVALHDSGPQVVPPPQRQLGTQELITWHVLRPTSDPLLRKSLGGF